MSYQMPPTGGPPTGGPPRSTPIPGQSTPIVGDGQAPTPGVFLGNQVVAPPTPTAFQLATAKEKNWGFWIIAVIIGLSTLGGIAAAVWGVLAAKDAVDTANNITIPNVSGDGGDAGVSELIGGGPAATVAALDAGIPGDPTNFIEIILYPGYSFGTAQDPIQPDHLDRYMLQSGTLQAPEPQTNDPDAPNKVFTIDAVDWTAIAALAADAPRVAAVEEGEVTHIIVNRDIFTDVHDIVVRIYLTGPRGSAFIEATADGTVLRIV